MRLQQKAENGSSSDQKSQLNRHIPARLANRTTKLYDVVIVMKDVATAIALVHDMVNKVTS